MFATMRIALIALASVAISAALAVAQEQETDMKFFAGIVLGVDSTNRLLTVEEADLEGDEMTFSVPADAKITREEAPTELGAIHVGDPVSIEYWTGTMGAEAVTIKVITMPAT